LWEQASTNKDYNKIIYLLELLAAGYRARSASHPGGVYMDRLRGVRATTSTRSRGQ
jgi:hypothetical protein